MEQIKIDLVPNGVMSVAHASQFDVGRSMKFLLTNEGVAYTLAGTEVITMKLRKPDGTDDTISLVNTSSSYVEWTTVDGDLDLSGVYLAEITITSGDDVLGTANFLLKVEADPYNGKNIRIVTVGPADICSFETTLPEPYPSVLVNVLATGGNGTPDNPNPINGYSSANITRCGVNLCSNWQSGMIDTTNGKSIISNIYWLYTAEYIPTNGVMAISALRNLNALIYYYDANYNFTRIDQPIRYTNPNTSTPTASEKYMRFGFNVSGAEVANPVPSDYNYQVQFGSTPTSYHAYNGQTYAISFGQTVYGGVLDVTRGKLTVTWGSVDLGTLNYTYNSSSQTFVSTGLNSLAKFTGSPNIKANILCAYYVTKTLSVLNNVAENGIALGGSSGLSIKNLAYTDAIAFKASLDGIILAYELTTPFDIDLTPVQISALVGENNVFADCGETEVKYLAEG